MIDIEAAMLPISRVVQRRLVAASVVAALSLVPLDAAAAAADVDALWNQPQGVSVDSAFYVIQAWWDGVAHATQHDQTQRGIDELTQANADLLNAYTLLQRQHSGAGPQPVAIVDPLLSSVYNVVTGGNAKAPVGSLLNWANESLLKLEGRGSTDDIVQALLKDYRAKQAAADRDLNLTAGSDFAALWTANAGRDSAFLVKIKGVTTSADGLLGVLQEADQSTMALATKHSGDGGASAKTKVKDNPGKGHSANPPGKATPKKKG
jgi:hypothetical protein